MKESAFRLFFFISSTLVLTSSAIRGTNTPLFRKKKIKDSTTFKSKINSEKMRFHQNSGQPAAIYNINFQAKGDTPEEMAFDFLHNYRHLLQLNSDESLSDLQHYKTFKSEAGSTVRYHQTHQSIHVHNTDLAVTVNNRNEVTLVMSNYKPNISLKQNNLNPKVSIRSVLKSAMNKLSILSDEDLRYKKTNLMIYDHLEETKLVWRINLVPKAFPIDLELIFDATKGKLLSVQDLSFDLKGTDNTASPFNKENSKNLRSRSQNHGEPEKMLQDVRELLSDRRKIFDRLFEPSSNVQLYTPTDDMESPWAEYENDTSENLTLPPSSSPTAKEAEESNNNSEERVYGYVFDPDPLTTANESYKDGKGISDNLDRDSPEINRQRKNVELLDVTFEDGVYSLKGPFAEIVDTEEPFNGLFQQSSSNFDFTRSESGFEAVNSYYHIDAFMRYINEDLKIPVRPSMYEGGVRVDPHGLNGSDNSHYLSATQELAFGEGGVDDAEDADVLVHELGHGIHDWLTGGSYSRVEGLSEGFGDYLAASYGREKSKLDSTHPEYHHIYNWDGHNEYWGGRTTNVNAKYPKDLKGNKHWDGSIWSTCNMKIFDAIGKRKSDTVQLIGMSMTNSASNQLDAANAVLQAAFNLDYEHNDIETMTALYRECGYDVAMTFCGDGVKDEDEECDGNDIGDAICSGIGCNGGIPTCTSTCKLDFSSCLPDEDDVLFELDLQTDTYGDETSWILKNEEGTVVFSGQEYPSLRKFNERRCVPKGCYEFTIYDKFKDGLCCDWGDGGYSITFDGTELENTEEKFEEKASHKIGTCNIK